jgi:hypothetical protein
MSAIVLQVRDGRASWKEKEQRKRAKKKSKEKAGPSELGMTIKVNGKKKSRHPLSRMPAFKGNNF